MWGARVDSATVGPEYTPAREASPKRAIMDRFDHISERSRTSLRVLWDMTEEDAQDALIDGGFLADECLSQDGSVLGCAGTLHLSGGSAMRGLACKGVANKFRYRIHWLAGSVFQGHRYLGAKDILGIVACFGSGKDTELTALDTGISRQVIGFLLDRLRTAAVLVTEHARKSLLLDPSLPAIDLVLPSLTKKTLR